MTSDREYGDYLVDMRQAANDAREEYLEARAARGDRGKFERAMAKVRDTQPDEGDV
jgi:hypothetical protein